MRILVCEDDAVVVKVIELTLAAYNVEVTYVKDGRRGLDLLKLRNDMDMIITDIHMPYYNGDDILKLVREEQQKTIPIIMISSDVEEEVINLALKSGVNDFIAKPVNPEKLNKVLKKYLK